MKAPGQVPIPNWALALVRHQPLTECLAEDGRVLGRGRANPMRATATGRWVALRQGILVIKITTPRDVTAGDWMHVSFPPEADYLMPVVPDDTRHAASGT